jgi:hypothetical protein
MNPLINTMTDVWDEDHENYIEEHLFDPWCNCGRGNMCVYCLSKRARKIHLENLHYLVELFNNINNNFAPMKLLLFIKMTEYFLNNRYSIRTVPRQFILTYIYYDVFMDIHDRTFANLLIDNQYMYRYRRCASAMNAFTM